MNTTPWYEKLYPNKTEARDAIRDAERRGEIQRGACMILHLSEGFRILSNPAGLNICSR